MPRFFGAMFGNAPPHSPASLAPTEQDDELYDAEMTADILAATRAKDERRLRLKQLLTAVVQAEGASLQNSLVGIINTDAPVDAFEQNTDPTPETANSCIETQQLFAELMTWLQPTATVRLIRRRLRTLMRRIENFVRMCEIVQAQPKKAGAAARAISSLLS